MTKVMLIQNPVAGQKRPERVQDKLIAELKKHFDEVSLMREDEMSGICAKRACREGYDAIVSVGGDGTLDHVVTGMVQEAHRPKLCVLPGGTFNMVVRLMGLPMGAVRALKKIDFHRTAKMHVGKANDRYFSFILSTGVIPEEIHDASSEEKKKYGFLAYAYNIIRVLPRIKTKHGRVSDGDYVYEGPVGHMAYILNQDFIAFQNSIFSEEDAAGLLMILKDESVLTAFPVVNTILAKKKIIDEKDYTICRTSHFVFDTEDKETVFDLDGDLGGKTPIEVSVLKHHIEVYLPKKKKGLLGFLGLS